MKKTNLFLGTLLILVLASGNAYADIDPIFTQLAHKAGVIGKGLRDAGFLIAGFGLIVFSFMAIFNKISWKTLAYIMMSTFILSTMVGVIGYISDTSNPVPQFSDIQETASGNASGSMDAMNVQVDQAKGTAQVVGNTASPTLPGNPIGTGGAVIANQGVTGTGAPVASGTGTAGATPATPATVAGTPVASGTAGATLATAAGTPAAANTAAPAQMTEEEKKAAQEEAAQEKLEESVRNKMPELKIAGRAIGGPRQPRDLVGGALNISDVETAIADAKKLMEQWEKLSDEEKKTSYAQTLRRQYQETIEAGEARLERFRKAQQGEE